MSNVNYDQYRANTYNYPSFKANKGQGGLDIVTKPIDKVENIVNNTVDTFVPEPKSEETKKSHKNAIRVGSTILVLSAFVALLNPKFSSTMVNKLKTKSAKAGNKAKVDNSLMGFWNKVKEKSFNVLTNTIQVLNNGNSFKDEMFQKLCNKTVVTKKSHQGITNMFDKISRKTVFSKHNKVVKQMNNLDEIMKHYTSRLSDSEKALFDNKLAEIDKMQEYFNKTEVTKRLNAQEKAMENLEREVTDKMVAYKNGFKRNSGKNIEHSKDAFNFWAEDILMPTRNKLEEDGTKVINALVGDGKTEKGAYKEIVELLSPHLKTEELRAFEDCVNQTEQALRKANKTECIEYFDKKRDLMLGSAPTDVLTALISLVASGIAIGVADTKEDKISRVISGALPVFAGLGVSTALTAMLFSGGKGMALGTGSGMALSAIGSAASHAIFPKNPAKDNIAQTEKENEDEVKKA